MKTSMFWYKLAGAGLLSLGLLFSTGNSINVDNFIEVLEKLFISKTYEYDSFIDLNSNNNAIVNIDDPYSNRIIKETNTQILTYGVNKDADISIINQKYNLNGTIAKIRYKKKIFSIETNLIGLYNQ